MECMQRKIGWVKVIEAELWHDFVTLWQMSYHTLSDSEMMT